MWTHPSLDRGATHSVDGDRVLKGRVIVAYLHPLRSGGFRVATPDGARIGDASSRAQAMLMAVRHGEAPRCRR
jgi:hypothetical protein